MQEQPKPKYIYIYIAFQGFEILVQDFWVMRTPHRTCNRSPLLFSTHTPVIRAFPCSVRVRD